METCSFAVKPLYQQVAALLSRALPGGWTSITSLASTQSPLRLRWWGLLRLVRDAGLEGGPAWCARGPDRYLRLAELWIVESAGAHAEIMTPRLRLREH